MTFNCAYFLSPILSPQLYSCLSFLFLLVVLLYTFKVLRSQRIKYIGSGLVLLGGTLNSLERFTSTCVRDPYNFFNLFRFNIADVMVSIGVLVLVYLLLTDSKY